MINRTDKLSIVRQCRLLAISRSGYYYQPVQADHTDLTLMREIDEIHLSRPYLGVRRITDALQAKQFAVNHKRVHRLMRLMGIQALYPKARTSAPHPDHKIYPYLLRNLSIDHPDQVWATDISYLPMADGFAYLTVMMDWYSRKILSWRLSNTMDVTFCVDALEEALHYYEKPLIFNSDQGSQFTSDAFTTVLKEKAIRISMDGKGAWRDNILVERFWRSVKYEEVYLNAYESMAEARQRISEWIQFYNQERKHQTLGCTPDQMYSGAEPLKKVA